MDHDQNFKNLIIDYPLQALSLFAEHEAQELGTAVRITPIREEQLKARLGDRYRRLDIPLLVEWPDGKRGGIIFALEEESNTSRFSIHRLAHYCLDLAEMYETDRIVPVVIFLRKGKYPAQLSLGGQWSEYLKFHFIACTLKQLQAKQYYHSDNIVARLNLPNMKYAQEDKVEVFAQAVQGLFELEQDVNKQMKYIDFIDIYADLDKNEQRMYQQQYSEEAKKMIGIVERSRKEGKREGKREGKLEGFLEAEGLVLLRLLQNKFGELSENTRKQIEAADSDTLLQWLDRVLTANSVSEVVH